MHSKAVALFLSLGLATTVAACGKAAPDGGEEGGSVAPPNSAQTSQDQPSDGAMGSKTTADTPTPTDAESGKSATDPTATKEVPSPSDAVEDTGKSDSTMKDVPSGTASTDDGSEAGSETDDTSEGGEGGEGGESGE